MALDPCFEFFEIVAEELSSDPSRVLTSIDLSEKGHGSFIEDLKSEAKMSDANEAISNAVSVLNEHFIQKGSRLPFNYDSATGRFTATDQQYLRFVNSMVSLRSIGTRAREFECSVAERLKLRVTGSVHRVGFPRDTKKLRADFVGHLRTLGFTNKCILGQEKDGGLDILWMLPLGSIPHRPILSLQCKNSYLDIDDGDVSVGAGTRTLDQHEGLLPNIHVPCVLFNDYVHPLQFSAKRMNFVPLGLSDLALLEVPVSLELI